MSERTASVDSRGPAVAERVIREGSGARIEVVEPTERDREIVRSLWERLKRIAPASP